MSIAFHIPWYIAVIASFAAIVFSMYVYRITVPPVSAWNHILLIALRSAALTILILAICEPLLTIYRTYGERPVVSVLVDNTLSMTLTDATGNREQMLRSILNGPGFSKLSSAADVRFYSIAPAVRLLSAESLQCSGTTTDLAAAFASLEKKTDGHSSVTLLLSDGNFNQGGNPINSAERSHVPIFTIGIGDSSEQKDIAVGSIVTNSIAYVQSAVPLDVTIRSSGFHNRTITVSLLDEGTLIATEKLTLADSTGVAGERTVHFSFTPKSDGLHKYTVSVSSLDGEVTTKNNVRSVTVRVMKNKMKVLLLAGAPSADVSALEQSLAKDPNIETRLYVQQPDGSLRGKSGTTVQLPTALSETECLVLVGFPSAPTLASIVTAILNISTEKSIPVFLLLSRTMDYDKLRMLERILPVVIPVVQNTEQSVFANIPVAMQHHELLLETEDGGVWEKLPPIYAPITGFRTKPEAVTLATWRIQNVRLATPIIAFRSAGQMKSFAVLGYAISRWKLLAGASPETESFFDTWISTIIRWLVTRENGSTLRVQPSKEFFSRGEKAEFTIEAYNQSYQPLENADVRMEIERKNSGQKFEATIQPLVGGRFEGSVDMLPEGDFVYRATAAFNGAETGTATGRFSVGEQSIEFSDTKMNKPLLQQMATVSGGSYSDARSADAALNDLGSRPFMKAQERSSTHEFELWNMPLLLSVVVLLFGTEWIVRKRSGML